MKKIILGLVVSFLVVQTVDAKFNPPKNSGYLSAGDRQAKGYFSQAKELEDGKMTLEEYKSRTITRTEERIIRKDKKNGVYQTDEEIFKAMDTDQDGLVSEEEMSAYITKIRESGRQFY